eukprot:gene1802-1832_t
MYVLQTDHGTTVYLDPISATLRHGAAPEALRNVFLVERHGAMRLVHLPQHGPFLEIVFQPDGLSIELTPFQAEKPHQLWSIEPQHNGRFTLHSDGHYLCADHPGTVFRNRTAIGAWELFSRLPPKDAVKLPVAPLPKPAPERTLVCVLGQLRAGHKTWPGFKRHVLDELGADLALAIGAAPDQDTENPFWQHATHRWVFPEYQDFSEGFDEAQRVLAEANGAAPQQWRQVLAIAGNWIGGVEGPTVRHGGGAVVMFMRWFLLNRLVATGVLDHYDRFVVTRSDFLWMAPHPPLSVLRPDAVWIPEGEAHGGVTDRHIVVSRQDLAACLGLIDEVVLRPDRLLSEITAPEINLEAFLAHCLRKHGALQRAHWFPYIMFLVATQADTTRWSHGEWDDKLGLRVKYPFERQLAMAWEGRLADAADWHRLFADRPELFRPIGADLR